jgi:hypothetical protein
MRCRARPDDLTTAKTASHYRSRPREQAPWTHVILMILAAEGTSRESTATR